MKTKAWLVLAVSLILLGCILFAGIMISLEWDFSRLSSTKYESNTYEVREDFDHISMQTDTAAVTLLPAEDGRCKVECYEEEKAKHSVTVENNTLVIRVETQKSWYDYIGIDTDSPRITVYLPKAAYASLSLEESTGSIQIPDAFSFADVTVSLSTGAVDFSAPVSRTVKMEASTGSIRVENISAGTLELSVSTGTISVSGVACDGDVKLRVTTGRCELTDVTCRNLTARGSTGDLYLNQVIASGTMSLERSTGDIRFNGADAAEIYVETDTGDVTGTLLSDKVFIAETDTGSISVPKTASGGRCEVTTDTGDIRLNIEP